MLRVKSHPRERDEKDKRKYKISAKIVWNWCPHDLADILSFFYLSHLSLSDDFHSRSTFRYTGTGAMLVYRIYSIRKTSFANEANEC